MGDAKLELGPRLEAGHLACQLILVPQVVGVEERDEGAGRGVQPAVARRRGAAIGLADISDALEPAVIDKEYGSDEELAAILSELYVSYNVPKEYQPELKVEPNSRYGLLLFRVYMKDKSFGHFPILINNDNRLQISNFFNFFFCRFIYLHNCGMCLFSC